MIHVNIGNKQYVVKEARTEEEKKKGLQKVKELPENGGMLFYYDPPQEADIWMKNTLIPLDIIFINEDYEVMKVSRGKPKDTEHHYICLDTAFVLEVNAGSGIQVGDEVDIDPDHGPVMKVLMQDGRTQVNLWGGERIISRRETKILVNKAKKARKSKDNKDYKALGKYIFNVFKKQDTRKPEYVESPK